MDVVSLVCCLVAGLLYHNTLDAGFVYDDSRAILSNQDILPSTSITRLLVDDFWGTPLSHSGSHGSYRPLCVLSFRLNYLAGGFRPWGYHLVNVLLHCLATGLVVRLARVLFPAGAALPAAVAGLLFAAHPVHTEAVAGVVGRAELAACVFYLLAFLCYVAHVRSRDAVLALSRRQWRSHLLATAKRHSATFADVHAQCYTTCQRCTGPWLERRPKPTSTWYDDEKHSKYRNNNNNDTTTNNNNSNNFSASNKIVNNLTNNNLHSKYFCECSGKQAWRCECRGPRVRQWVYFCACVLFASCAILSKETGATVLALCAVYDALAHISKWRGLTLGEIYSKRRGRGVLVSLFGLAVALCALLLLRLHLMGMRTPGFAKADNPTARCPSLLTRTLTFAFLPTFNFGLLLWPRWLSFDWSMDAIPRISSMFDPRSAITLLFYYILYRITRTAFNRLYFHQQPQQKQVQYRKPHRHSYRRTIHRYGSKPTLAESSECTKPSSTPCPVCRHSLLDHSALCRNNNNNNTIPMVGGTVPCCCNAASVDVKSVPRPQRRHVSRSNLTSAHILLLSLTFMAVPFVPATNLFFYVGFVVAERVLYIPSVGYCLIIGLGCHVLQAKTNKKTVLACVTLLLVTFSARTIQRNKDWLDEESLYRAGVPINPPKAYGNLGSVLSSRGKMAEAEWAFRMALKYRSNMADVHYNLGILLQNREQYDEAAHSYQLAIQYRPALAVAHLNLGQLLETLGRCQEAMAVYRRCSQLDGTGLKDPRSHEATKLSALLHLGRLYAEQGQHQQAISVYQEALQSSPDNFPHHTVHSQLDEVRARLQQYRTRRVAVTSQPESAAHTQRHTLHKNRSRILEAEPWFVANKQIPPDVLQQLGVAESTGPNRHVTSEHQPERSDSAPT